MAKASYIVRIRSRIDELEGLLKEMARELDELRIAERVIGRLGVPEDEDDPAYPRSAKTRTVSDLIVDVLANFGPMESREIFEKAREVHETTSNTVSTTLSRMKDQGLVSLEGRIWSLIPQKEEASPAQAKEASKLEDGETDTPDIFS